jgi:hypothetical protein
MRAISDRSLSLSMRCYRGLLRAYPQAFLADFEDLLVQAFGDLAHRAVRTKGVWGLFVLWMRTIPDLISSALNQRFQLKSNWSFRVRWIGACAIGSLCGAIVMVVVGDWINRFLIARGINIHTSFLLHPDLRGHFEFRMMVLQYAATFGFILGCFQALAYRWSIGRRVAWILLTMFGMTFAVGGLLIAPQISSFLSATIHSFAVQIEFLAYLGTIVICASPMGLLQATVLSGRNARGLAWMLVSTIAVIACGILFGMARSVMLPILFARGLPTFYDTEALLMGIAYGFLTVLPLEWILQPKTAQASIPDGSNELPT